MWGEIYYSTVSSADGNNKNESELLVLGNGHTQNYYSSYVLAPIAAGTRTPYMAAREASVCPIDAACTSRVWAFSSLSEAPKGSRG